MQLIHRHRMYLGWTKGLGCTLQGLLAFGITNKRTRNGHVLASVRVSFARRKFIVFLIPSAA